MTLRSNRLSLLPLGLALLAAAPAGAQEPPTPPPPLVPPTLEPAEPAVKLPAGTVARVDDFDITETAVEARFMVIVAERTQGQMLPPEQMAKARQQFRPSIIEDLINDRLLDVDVAEAKVTATQEELLAILEIGFELQLQRSGLSRDELEARMQQAQGLTIEAALKRQSEDPEFRRVVLHKRLLEQTYAKDVVVTDEEIKERYTADLEERYTRPLMVRASHILLGSQGMDEAARTTALAEAERIRAECLASDADFSALAKQYSTGPTGPQGGDLGFFPREGGMVEPFAAAAFALAVGDISAVVETQFGFHVIEVTERREAEVISMEQAAGGIKEEILFEKLGPIRERHLAKLRAAATITQA